MHRDQARRADSRSAPISPAALPIDVKGGLTRVTRNCDFCGAAYGARRSTSRFCSDNCRKRNHLTPLPRPVPQQHPAVAADHSILDATRAELQAAGRLDSWRGQLALLLAERMGGFETGGAMAALSRELSRVIVEVMRDTPAAAELIDEVRRRRDRKRGSRSRPL